MTKINKSAQEVIDRLAELNYDEPIFNETEIIKAFEKQYKLLDIEMPKVEAAENMLVGYELARGAAWDAARGAAARNTSLKDKATLKWIEVSEQELLALENGLGWFFPMKDKLILVPMPRMIMDGDRLHYDHGMAVSWNGGVGFYFLRGVQFDEDLYWKVVDHKLSAEETLLIPNSDQRMAAISMLRPDRLLKQMNAELIDSGEKGTRLYEVKNFMDTGRTEYCMLMDDASTDRQFIEWVEPKVGELADAELCQARAFGITKEQWLNVGQEA